MPNNLNIGIAGSSPSMLGRYLTTLNSYNNSFTAELILGQSGRVELEGWDRVNKVFPVSIPGGVNLAPTVASGSADSGNPMKIGGVYHLTPQSFADGQRADLQVDQTGAIRTNPGPLSSTYDSILVVQGTPAALGAAWSVRVTDGTNILGSTSFPINISLPAGGTPTAGQLAAGTGAAVLGANTPCKGVVLQSDPTNTPDILIGTSSNQFIRLLPGQTMYLPVSNVNLIYAKTSSTTGSVNWMAVN